MSASLSISTGPDRVAAIVGGSGGIGTAIARSFQAQGASQIILIARDEARGYAAAEALGSEVSFLVGDGNDALSMERVVNQIRQTYGRLDTLVVATAGAALPQIFQDIPIHEIAAILNQQVLAPMIASSAALPLMRATRGSSIVVIASDAAKLPTPGETVIGAAMAAIVCFARTLAVEVKREGIRVNAVTPSIVEGTALYDRLMMDPFSARLFQKAQKAAGLGPTTPKDVADLVAFLCSDAASRITGQVISVNGGISSV